MVVIGGSAGAALAGVCYGKAKQALERGRAIRTTAMLRTAPDAAE